MRDYRKRNGLLVREYEPADIARLNRLEGLQRACCFLPPFGAPFQAPFATSGAAAAVPWYLSGGVAAANCIAAYQPKGAVDLAASYVNLANPGTYDAAPGTAPTWDVVNGWKFSKVGTPYLKTGITPTDHTQWSMIGRFSNGDVLDSAFFLGHWDGATAKGWMMANARATPIANRRYYNGTVALNHDPVTGGRMAIAGGTAYYNGVNDGVITLSAGSDYEIYLGAASNKATGLPFAGNNIYIQAAAIYNVVLSGPQLVLVDAAIAAL